MTSNRAAAVNLPIAPALIPVIDLMIGQAVLARNGDRAIYQPVHSKLSKTSDPVAVARALFGQTGCDCIYVADLDSFEGASPSWPIYRELLNAGFQIWVDADWFASPQRLDELAETSTSPRFRPIVSTEQMSSDRQFDQVGKMCEDNLRPLFSVDLREGKLRSRGDLCDHCPRNVIKQAVGAGIDTLIWLDVAGVGTARGVESMLPSLLWIRENYPEVKLISGGGVRCPEDARQLMQAGCQHVLAASAIHQCRFRPDDVSQLSRMRDALVGG